MTVRLNNFKLAFRAAVLERPSGIPPHLMAKMLGVDLAVLYAWAEPDDNRVIPLHKFIKFSRISGDRRIMDAICGVFARAFVRIV